MKNYHVLQKDPVLCSKLCFKLKPKCLWYINFVTQRMSYGSKAVKS